MPTNLFIQLLVSFLVGGGLITLLSVIAEKTNEQTAGIIMIFPSTVVLGFFFLGIATSAAKVAEVVPATLIPLGIVILSSVIYIQLALLYTKVFASKVLQIVSTFISASIIWFLLAAPFAVWKLNNLPIGIIGYLVLISLAYYLLNRKQADSTLTKFKYTKLQIAFRAAFIGSIIAFVVLLGKTLNPFWGGIFTMYPAATLAILVVLHFYYQPENLFYFFKKAPIGSLSIFVYCITVMLLFPPLGVVLGTLAAYIICLLFTLLLIKWQQKITWK